MLQGAQLWLGGVCFVLGVTRYHNRSFPGSSATNSFPGCSPTEQSLGCLCCSLVVSSQRLDLQPVVFTRMDRLVTETGLDGLIIVCRGFAAWKLQTPTLFLHIYMAKTHPEGFQFRYINSLY